jgi:hypothetical protein
MGSKLSNCTAAILVCTVGAGWPAAVHAQGRTVTDLGKLSQYESRTVWVTRRELGTLNGRLLHASDRGLDVQVNDRKQTIPVTEIETVMLEENGAKRGALIGFGFGVPIATLAVLISSKPSSAGGKMAAGAVGVGTYAAIGALLGALNHKRVTVYRRPAADDAALARTAPLQRDRPGG